MPGEVEVRHEPPVCAGEARRAFPQLCQGKKGKNALCPGCFFLREKERVGRRGIVSENYAANGVNRRVAEKTRAIYQTLL